MNTLPTILFSGFILSVAWFLAGGVLYMNPLVAKIYKKHEASPVMKHWKSQPRYMGAMYGLGVLVPSLITAFVYYQLAPIGVLGFGLLLAGVRMLPRFIDMWIQTSYPNSLLAIELVNGTILSFGAAWVLGVV